MNNNIDQTTKIALFQSKRDESFSILFSKGEGQIEPTLALGFHTAGRKQKLCVYWDAMKSRVKVVVKLSCLQFVDN